MSDRMSPVENITFEGKGNESVTQFLQRVKQVAFAQGRQRDQEWLADYVETCLSEKALEWYISLDEDTQRNFTRLRIAMVERFRSSTPVNIAPAPAAAPPPASAPPPPTPKSSFLSYPPAPVPQKRRGRMKIVRNDSLNPGYCGAELYHAGSKRWECDRMASISEALIVELWTPSDPTRTSQSLLKVVSTDESLFLGVAIFTSPGGKSAWILCFCDEGGYSGAKSPKNYGRKAESRVWALNYGTQELSMKWVGDNGETFALELRANTNDTDNIWIRSVDDASLESSCRAKLYFDPL